MCKGDKIHAACKMTYIESKWAFSGWSMAQHSEFPCQTCNRSLIITSHYSIGAKKLSGAKKTPSATPGEATSSVTPGETASSGPLPLVISPAPTADPINTESSREELVQESSSQGIAEPLVTGGNQNKRSAPSSSASVEIRTGSEPDEPPKKRKKKEKKKKKRTIGERSEPSEDVGGRELVAFDSFNRDVTAWTSVELDQSPNVPLERKKKSSHEGSVPASVEKSPPAAPSATRRSGSSSKRGPVKFPDHVEFKYDGDTPLAYAPMECAELVRQIRGGAKDMPQSDRSMNFVVEMYDTALKETIFKLKQTDKIVRAKDTALNRKTSEFKATIDKAAAEQSRLLEEKKAKKEKFGELKDKFKTAGEKIRGLEREKAALEKEKAAWESKKADHAIERSNDPTERNLEELSVREQGDVSGVERTEDASGLTIAPIVPDPDPVASNLVVNEEPSTPTLGARDATLTLPLGEDGAGSNPVDLLELSDSSAGEDDGEKSGGEKSDEQVPDSNPQGTEGNFGESSAKEQGNVDEVENPSDPMIDGTGSASDQLGAQVVGEDFDRAED
ncbi:hypothetical protein Bca52824_087826 [Brassica carinata]|uniref:Uncharacterized protein n=1 Tax=Brassica carinata TaxID=52824 RepID=A0A8X7PD35_BRACI|nr:hypothetical protein Bca52824_087826 [Brassica carinata]